MPNKQTHLSFALILLSLIFIFLIGIHFVLDYVFHIGLFLLGSILPDFLEPATDYKHRKFFHSKLFLLILSIGLVILFFSANSFSFSYLVIALLGGYILHLIMDATSKMGLPLVYSYTNENNYEMENDIVPGYCIRCHKSIPEFIDKPLCENCFKECNRFKNIDYNENYCHLCGKDYKTTIRKPYCKQCYYE